MGGKSSKNKGKKEQAPNTITSQEESTINLTNNVIIGHSKSDPNEEYNKLNFLGEGSFAAVYKVQNKLTGQVRAMKIIKKSATCTEQDDQEIVNEINILRTMDHPNILKIFEFYSNKESYSIVTELCSGGNFSRKSLIKDHLMRGTVLM